MAKAAFNGTVQLKGFKEARAKLKQDPPFFAPAARRYLDRLGATGQSAALAASPRGATGQLAASNVYKVQDKPFPTWVRVSNKARAKGRLAKRQSKKARAGLAPLRYAKGASYPFILNAGDHKRGRTKHIGWFTRAMRLTSSRSDALLAGMGDQIQKEWAA